MRPFVYLSIDGVLGHLGFSQVFRVLEGLGRRGLPSVLVTLERDSELANHERADWLANRARAAGIEWIWGRYVEDGSSAAAVRNLATMARLTTRAALRVRPTHFHARGYQAGAVTLGIQALFRRPWIFDARGYWIDERLEEGRWFTRDSTLRTARRLERRMYRSADAVVTLTSLHAQDLPRLHLRDQARPADVIPTCADYMDFRPRAQSDLGAVPVHVRDKMSGRPVIGIIGSMNRAYLPQETASLAARALDRTPEAQVLVLTKQVREWTQALLAAGVQNERMTVATAEHEAMPEWLNLMTWCLMLLREETQAKRAAMPTKLAELFASGVQVAFHGCNSEAADWVRRTGSGIVLNSVTPPALDAAAQTMSQSTVSTGTGSGGRLASQHHFSLEAGLARYESLIRRLLATPDQSSHPTS